MGDAYDAGFSSTAPAEGFSVCGRCIDDDDIKTFIETQADSLTCDFCGYRARKRQIAAPLPDVVEFMLEAIEREYERAVEALGWDGREGGYQGRHFDSSDLLMEEIGLGLPNDDSGQLLEILTNCLGDEPWCERDPYALREDERLIASWEQFCEFIKHQRRYFFLQPQGREAAVDREHLAPAELLEFIGQVVEDHGLIRTLPAESIIYRARQQKAGQVFTSPYDLGPPPEEFAIRANRMSPAGVVMFYGSEEAATAVAEIDDKPELGIVVGTFRTTREARLLDLTQLPRTLRFFEHQGDNDTRDRYAIEFLHSFVQSLAKKVESENREHVDYVPTQVVTEWFRTMFRTPQLDGIRYLSAARPRGTSLVLFANRYDIVLPPDELERRAGPGLLDAWYLRTRQERAWLQLVRKRTVRAPKLVP